MTVTAEQPRRLRTPRLLDSPAPWLALALLACALTLEHLYGHGMWQQGFYFDEMWRADFIRTSLPDIRHEMLTHDTPVPWGWVLAMKLVMWPLPDQTLWFRFVGAGSMVVGFVLVGLLFVRIGRRGEPELHPLVGAFSAAPLLAVLPIGIFATYFNNYGFEVLYSAVLVLATFELGRARWAWPTLIALVAIAPAMTLGGLFILPGVAACAAVWARRESDARRRLITLAVACGVCVVVAAVSWVKLYHPMSKPELRSFWIDLGASLGGSRNVFDLLGHAVTQFRDGAVGSQALAAGGAILLFATIVVAIGFVVGAIAVARRWSWLLVIAGSAQLFTIAGSATVRWPMSVERVNLAFQVFWFALVAIGVAIVVAKAVGRVGLPALAALPLLVAAIVGLWPPAQKADATVFARRLKSDLQVVASSRAPRNVLVQYHWLAHFYSHDLLINTPHPGHRFEIVSERYQDDSLRQPIDSVIARERLRPGDMLWCNMPSEIGPEGTAQACRFTNAHLRKVVDRTGQMSITRGYVVTR